MVDNLAKRGHALFAAHALLILMKYRDTKDRILDTKVDLRLLQMIEKHVFDGTIHQEGIHILSEIFKNGDFRSIMLRPRSFDSSSWTFRGTIAPQRLHKKVVNYVRKKVTHRSVQKPYAEYPRNVIGILRKMLENTQLDSVQKSAIRYLNLIADHEDALSCIAGSGIVEALLWCIKIVDIPAVKDVLQKIARHKTLRGEIINADNMLADMLSSHYPAEIRRVTTALKCLSHYRELRQEVQSMAAYQNLKKDPLHYLDPHHHPHENDQSFFNVPSPC
ncbi:hypothetical protein EDB19DRAFT_762518 [Suillus lakei]|nr:hypothetical protein EDB19DRAFT_762518 [Suillus lakei]